jgi:4-hydroxyproline epimerase
MTRHTFNCIDAHTCGNPVRVVMSGAPMVEAPDASARRQRFMADHDWIRTGLMFEPRGHDMMSGAILYPSTRPDCDAGIVFIETSGCLPMCGHGAIGTVTVAIEEGLVTPAVPGTLRLDTPAGPVEAAYETNADGLVESVRIRNIASYLAAEGVEIDCPELGRLTLDIAYGGNFYAIVDAQENFRDMADLLATGGASKIVQLSPVVRQLINEAIDIAHPKDPSIKGVSHVMWTGAATVDGADARNAVFYGDKAIDRSPCGTGTSARMAQWAAKGKLAPGDSFVHESIIGSLFTGRVEATATVGNHDAIVPSIEGWARITGHNTIFIDDRDPYAHGFQVV